MMSTINNNLLKMYDTHKIYKSNISIINNYASYINTHRDSLIMFGKM